MSKKKKMNGKVTFTTKELIQEIHKTTDIIQKDVSILKEKFSDQVKECNNSFMDKKTFWIIIGSLTAAFSGAVVFIIKWVRGLN